MQELNTSGLLDLMENMGAVDECKVDMYSFFSTATLKIRIFKCCMTGTFVE